MSASDLLRVSLDLAAFGFAEASDLPLLTREERARISTAIRRAARHADLPSLAMLPGLEDRDAPVGLYGWPTAGSL